MENYKELVEIMLPEGILQFFNFEGLSKTPHSYKITLEEKNRLPKLPIEYSIRKVILRVRRRVWKIEGVKNLFKNDLSLTMQGTKLEKEFAAFLKEIN